MKGIIYTRVSSDEQIKGTSLDFQEEYAKVDNFKEQITKELASRIGNMTKLYSRQLGENYEN